jgi:hypothetical protein
MNRQRHGDGRQRFELAATPTADPRGEGLRGSAGQAGRGARDMLRAGSRRPMLAMLWCAAALAGSFAAGAVAAAPLHLQLIQRLVAEQRIDSVEQLLSNLPLPLRSRYVLVFASRSLQSSSYQSPRAILYGSGARFLVAFNGDPQDRGFESVEMMEFDEATRRFQLQELTFSALPDGSRKADFSAINPERCATCHGQEPRPIWEPHPVWPGAYGQVYRRPLSREEEDSFDAFARNQPSHPRYRFLAAVEDFAYRMRFRPSAKDRYDDVQIEAPNAELTNLLGTLNLRSIVATVTAQRKFDLYRYALLAALTTDCTDLAEHFPTDARPTVRTAFKAFSDRTDSLNRQHLERTRARLESDSDPTRFASDAVVDDHDSLKRFRFVVEFGLGLKTEGWSLAFEKDSYNFAMQRPVMAELERLILRDIASKDPELEQRHTYGSQTRSIKHCAYLAARSRNNLEQAQAHALPP